MVATRIASARLSVETPRRTDRSIRGRMRSSGPIERGIGNHIGQQRYPPHLIGELTRHVRDRPAVGADRDQRDRAQSVLVDKPVANVGNVFELSADGQLEFLLRDRSLRLRRVIDDQRSPANLRRSLRHASAVDEDAGDLGPRAQQRDDILGHLFGVGQPRARRQLDGEQRPRGVLRRQEALATEALCSSIEAANITRPTPTVAK